MISERDEIQTIIAMMPPTSYLSRNVEGNMGIQNLIVPDPATAPRLDSEGNPVLDENGEAIVDTLPLVLGEWISFEDFKKLHKLFQYAE